MPQMKPMNWLMLYISLNIILMMINIMNYFILNLNNENNFKDKKLMKKNINWKW